MKTPPLLRLCAVGIMLYIYLQGCSEKTNVRHQKSSTAPKQEPKLRAVSAHPEPPEKQWPALDEVEQTRTPRAILRTWFKQCKNRDEFKQRACNKRREVAFNSLSSSVFRVRTTRVRLGKYNFDTGAFPLLITHPIAKARVGKDRTATSAYGIVLGDGAYLTIAEIAPYHRENTVPKIGAIKAKIADISVPEAKARRYKLRNKRLNAELLCQVGDEWEYKRNPTGLEAGMGVQGATVYGLRLVCGPIRVLAKRKKKELFAGSLGGKMR